MDERAHAPARAAVRLRLHAHTDPRQRASRLRRAARSLARDWLVAVWHAVDGCVGRGAHAHEYWRQRERQRRMARPAVGAAACHAAAQRYSTYLSTVAKANGRSPVECSVGFSTHRPFSPAGAYLPVACVQRSGCTGLRLPSAHRILRIPARPTPPRRADPIQPTSAAAACDRSLSGQCCRQTRLLCSAQQWHGLGWTVRQSAHCFVPVASGLAQYV